MKVIVGSRNPTKVGAVKDVFERFFGQIEVEGFEVDPGVAGQPVGDETFAGAENRTRALIRLNTDQMLGADYCVGIEGGVAEAHHRWFAFGVICIADSRGRLGFGITSHFELPPRVTDDLKGGAELGDVIDVLAGQQHTRLAGGAIGYLSHGRLDRRGLAAQGIFMALLPFLNEEQFFRT